VQRRIVVLVVAVVGVVLASLASADEPKADATLVRCGSDQVAIFPDTTSKDGRFAVGWTIRGHGKPAPAPWAVYDPDDQALHGRMSLLLDDEGALRKGDYTPVVGLVDLRAKQFTVLPSEEPPFPGQARADLSVRWYEPKGVARYGVIINNHDGNSSQFTIDLSLIDLSGKQARVVALKPAAEQAIGKFLQARDPKDHARYEWRCGLDRISKTSRAPFDAFTSDELTLPFEADIPGEPQNVDAGLVRFSLPSGAVRGSTPDEAARRSLRSP
jgi:hypothetical protein